MTQYMFSVIHADEAFDDWTPDQIQAIYEGVDKFNAEVKAAGQWVFGGGLQPSSSATVVRAHEGPTVVTDGPYLETKEHLGGFWILELADMDEALKVGERASAACGGPVEVRPFQDEPAE